jgi:hypothetical protein
MKVAHAALAGAAYRKSGGMGHPISWQGELLNPVAAWNDVEFKESRMSFDSATNLTRKSGKSFVR